MSLLLRMSSFLLPYSGLSASPNLAFSLSFNVLDRLPFIDRLPIDDPVTIFLVIVGIMLLAPLLFERLGLPGIVGLILAFYFLSARRAGTLLPLNVLSDHKGKISVLQQLVQQRLLAEAENLAHSAVVEVEPILRVDYSPSKGIVRASWEHQASLIVCGWKGYSHYRDRTFGNVVDRMLQQATVPVLVTRFRQPLNTIERVVLAVPVERQLSRSAQLSFVIPTFGRYF